jgi:hypothetical protein
VWEGFFVVLYVASPNDQYHEVGELIDVSVNETASGGLPEVGVPVKLATGAITVELTVM